jgi:hypothetical protein
MAAARNVIIMPTKTPIKDGKRSASRPTPANAENAEIPNHQTGEQEFFEHLQRFTTDEWQSGLKVYVYRTWPVIDKRDENHFLAKVSEAFDEDYLLRHFGSGKYYLRLNNRHGETLNSKTVSIHNPAYPPKVCPDEVVQTDPRNERYFKVWPVAPVPETVSTADNAAVHELSKLATKVIEQKENAPAFEAEQSTLTAMLVKWALEQTSKERDGSDPTRMAALLKELRTLLPTQQPAADGLAVVDRVLSIVEKLNPQRAKAETQDPLDYVEKVLGLTERLRPHRTESPVVSDDGSSLTAVAAIVHEAVELLKNPVAIATQVWAASRNRNTTSTPTTAPPPQQSVPQTPQPDPPRPAESDTGKTAPQPPQPPPQPIIALANAITPVMLKWLHEDAPGEELGANFAAWVVDGWGHEDLKSIQEVGSQNLVELYRHSPVWIVLAQMETKFQRFVDAFVAWQPTDDLDTESGIDSNTEAIDLDA